MVSRTKQLAQKSSLVGKRDISVVVKHALLPLYFVIKLSRKAKAIQKSCVYSVVYVVLG